MQPFIAANKAVFGAMYKGSTSTFCPSSITAGYSFILKHLNLDSWVEFCRPANFVPTNVTAAIPTLLPTATQKPTTTNAVTLTTTASPQRHRRNSTLIVAVVVVVVTLVIVALIAAIIALIVYKRKRGLTFNNFRNSRQLAAVDATELYSGSNVTLVPPRCTVDA